MLVIHGSTEPADDGAYIISTVNESSIYVDDSLVTFLGELEPDTSVVYIIRSCIPAGEMTFEESVSIDGSIIFDCLIDEEKNLFHKKKILVHATNEL